MRRSTTVSRRRVLAGAGLAAAGGLTGDLAMASELGLSALRGRSIELVPTGPFEGGDPPTGAHARTVHALNRWTYGATTALVDHVRRTGLDAYLDQQLAPDTVADATMAVRLAGFETLLLPPGMVADQHRDRPHVPVLELQLAALLRAVYSERQLYERMVELWSDHFSIHVHGGAQWFLKPSDDREVIRRHALGSFRELLVASAQSPAMLMYLDNWVSTRNKPNENYARELLELHTVGAGGGYDETTVRSVARLLTGWTIDWNNGNATQRYRYRFNAQAHDPDPVAVTIGGLTWLSSGSPTGEADGVSFLTWLARHPATARRVATKIARRFVGDEPPAALVDSAVQVYLHHDTAIAPVVRHIVTSDAFWTSAGAKLRRPFDLFAAALRVLEAEVEELGASAGVAASRTALAAASDHDPVLGELGRSTGGLLAGTAALGEAPKSARGLRHLLDQCHHAPFTWAPPDGFPDHADAWLHTAGLLARWNGVLTLTRGIPGVTIPWNALYGSRPPATAGAVVDHWFQRLTLAPGAPAHRDTIVAFTGKADRDPVDDAWRSAWQHRIAGLVLSTPRFQVR